MSPIFLPTSLPTISFLLSWQCWEYILGSGGKLKEKDKQGADSHTSSIIITASSCEIFSVLKFLVFLEKMVLGGTLNSIILRIRTIVLQRNLQPTCRTSAQQILTLGKASSKTMQWTSSNHNKIEKRTCLSRLDSSLINYIKAVLLPQAKKGPYSLSAYVH